MSEEKNCGNCYFYNGDMRDVEAFCDDREEFVHRGYDCNRYMPKDRFYNYTTTDCGDCKARIRNEVIKEALTLINEITTFYCRDKEGNAITPKMIVKDEVIKVIEQLKEK